MTVDDCTDCHGRSVVRETTTPDGIAQAVRASVDNSAWDGPAAMSACSNSDTPASCFGSICAGKKAGDTATQAAWALPHHKHPGDPPNAAGVQNSLSRLPQTDGLTNAAAAKSHLEPHMKTINPDYDPAKGLGTPNEQRAAALGARSAIGSPARMESFRAQWRHEPVKLNGKSLHQLDGMASVVGVEYEMWDMWGPYGETVHPDAFGQTLAANPDTAFLVNHKGMTMARTKNGTLQLDADPAPLHALAYVNPERSDVHDLLVAIDDEDITEMSFAFMITDGEWDDDYEHFTILGVDLDRGDVSAVNYGANPYTSIAARQREVMRDLMHLPDGAQRAAMEQLALRFGGVLVPVGHEPGLTELTMTPAVLAAAARAQTERERQQPPPVMGDPVAEANAGRSVDLVRALLEADL